MGIKCNVFKEFFMNLLASTQVFLNLTFFL